jgi:bifunctional non-homologous end joining protein LigD
MYYSRLLGADVIAALAAELDRPTVLRARELPTVSTPVSWEEVEGALERDDREYLVFEAGQVLKRVDRHGDLFAPVLQLQQELPQL